MMMSNPEADERPRVAAPVVRVHLVQHTLTLPLTASADMGEVPTPTFSLPEVGAPKKAKSSWPPVPVGTCFFVERTDAE